jgi:hypothetical protein
MPVPNYGLALFISASSQCLIIPPFFDWQGQDAFYITSLLDRAQYIS